MSLRVVSCCDAPSTLQHLRPPPPIRSTCCFGCILHQFGNARCLSLSSTCYGNINPTAANLAQDLGARADVEVMVRYVVVVVVAPSRQGSAPVVPQLHVPPWCFVGEVLLVHAAIVCSASSSLYAVMTGFSTSTTGTGFAANYMTQKYTFSSSYVAVSGCCG